MDFPTQKNERRELPPTVRRPEPFLKLPDSSQSMRDKSAKSRYSN